MTPEKMMQIFDLPLSEGGPTFISPGPITTYYQMVVTPADLTLWLKARGYSGWEKIELKTLFK
jgi:hypothetical protein